MSDDPATRLRENATEVATMLVTGLWLALLFSGFGGQLWLAVLLVGYMVVIPLVALLYGDEDDRKEWWDDWWGDESWDEWWGDESESADEPQPNEANLSPNNRDALETLRARYANGELTDEQFEHKLERLLEVETIEDAEDWKRGRRDDRDRGRDRDLEYET